MLGHQNPTVRHRPRQTRPGTLQLPRSAILSTTDLVHHSSGCTHGFALGQSIGPQHAAQVSFFSFDVSVIYIIYPLFQYSRLLWSPLMSLTCFVPQTRCRTDLSVESPSSSMTSCFDGLHSRSSSCSAATLSFGSDKRT